MTSDDEHLRDKARLLLQRERELFELRQKHEQVGAWLSLGQALPGLFASRDGSLAQAWDGIRKTVLSKLRVQRVLLLEAYPGELRALAPAGPPRPLPAEARALFEARTAGHCNDPKSDPTPGLLALATAIGLDRFMWGRIDRPKQEPILMAAGFDAQKAIFQSPFVSSDIAHFASTTQLVQYLLGNAQLIAELEREKNQLREANVSLELRDQELRQAAERLRQANESLEQRVQERTQDLASKNRELRLVLDSVDQALLTVDLEGRLAPEHSSVAADWFGAYSGSPKFAEHVGADRRFVMLFELGLAGLREDFLPREVCLEQMPKRLVRGARQFDCRYLPIDEEGRLLGLLLAIDDVTELLARAREDAEQRELLAAFEALMRDKNGFFTFFEEAEQLFAQLAGDHVDPALQKRLLHTLKGSAGTFGLRLLAELCHQAESDLERDGTCAETLGQLRTRWAEIVSTFRAIAPTVGKTIEVSEQQLAYLTERARQGAAAEQLVEELRRLGWEPSERALGRLAQHARALASRLGKGSLEVQIDADETRLEPERWAPLWSALVQVVRNAVDHGIEPPEQRIAEGKPAVGRLRLAARRIELGYQLEIEDDGRGIDWETIRRGCEQRGRPSATRADLLAAILSPDFSTRAHVTETSGRGIGLSLLDRAVQELSGQLALESEPKRGTRWVLTFPSLGIHRSAPGEQT